MRLLVEEVGALGATRFGTQLVPEGEGESGLVAGTALGIGGGALGFSKLPSWFCGNRGLDGGEVSAVNGV